MNFSMNEQTVVVFGASGGIGLAVARAAAAAGARVVLSSRDEAKLREAVDGIEGDVVVKAADVTDADQVAAVFTAAGPTHHLLVTAKGGPTGRFGEQATADARKRMEVDFWGTYACARAFAEQLPREPEQRRRCSGTFTSGGMTLRPEPGYHMVGVTHAACEALARALSVELAPARFNAVRAGLLDTPLYATTPADQKKAMFDAYAGAAPAGRAGTAEDLAGPVLALMASEFLTGVALPIDGGIALT